MKTIIVAIAALFVLIAAAPADALTHRYCHENPTARACQRQVAAAERHRQQAARHHRHVKQRHHRAADPAPLPAWK